MPSLPATNSGIRDNHRRGNGADFLHAKIRQKVEINSIRHTSLLHGKMYHIDNNGVHEAIFGRSNFTVRGLGLGQADNNIELNLEVDSSRDRQDLKTWFDELWNDAALIEDVKKDVFLYSSPHLP